MESQLKLWAYLAGIVASPAVLLAAIRAFVLFGEMRQTIKAFPEALTRLSETMDGVAARLGEHGERLAAVERGVEGLERREQLGRVGTYDRRAAP